MPTQVLDGVESKRRFGRRVPLVRLKDVVRLFLSAFSMTGRITLAEKDFRSLRRPYLSRFSTSSLRND